MAERGSERSPRRPWRRGMHAGASLIAATLPLACAMPRPTPPPQVENPFLGTWTTPEHTGITFRPDTVLENPPQGPPQAFDKDACGGVFSFRYATATRAALTALIPRQPGLRDKLSRLLPQPRYQVAKLTCDRGDQTYILLTDRELLAVYRDGDIGGIERLVKRGP
jgi:hypothetical protein